MPCFRGVDVSIITQPGDQKLPEFPHSDASSVRIIAPTDHSFTLNQCGLAADGADSPRIQKVSPRVSVYVPSAPGAQFGVHYSLDKVPEPPCHLYFKIFMNGRNVANCGINPVSQASGSITRSLCEPSSRWHYKENGIIHKRQGVEVRSFYFFPNSSRTSIADDGGLIEVQVFRARGRRRRAPILTKHRDQESYGIASPSGGLLDSPEDACYYDWVLIDPKEFPFVSFRFHYRSWSNLRQLNLAPAFTELSLPMKGTSQDVTAGSNEPCASRAAIGGHEEDRNNAELNDEISRLLQPITPGGSLLNENIPIIAPPGSSARPLPEIPVKKPTPKKSFESCTPSVAPSLLPYIEEEPTENEVVELGMATTIPVRSDSLRGGKPRSPALDGLEVRPRPLSLSRERTQPAACEPLTVPVRHSNLFMGQASSTSTETMGGDRGQYMLTKPPSELLPITLETVCLHVLSLDTSVLFQNLSSSLFSETCATKPYEQTTNGEPSDIPIMADSSWLRFLGGNRSRTHGLTSPRSEPALQDLLKSSKKGASVQTHHGRKSMTQLAGGQGSTCVDQDTPSDSAPSPAFASSEIEEADRIFINAGQQVWHSPSIHQVAEALQVGVMTNPANEPLSAQYRPYILYLLEGYGAIHQKVAKLEAELAEAKGELLKEAEQHKSTEEHYMVLEARYKAEIKRLELVIHEISGKVSRTRTMDTTNEVRMSRRFRRLDDVVSDVDDDGACRADEQEAEPGKTLSEQDRTEQHSERNTCFSSGSSSYGVGNDPPLEGNAEKKRNSTESRISDDTGVDGSSFTVACHTLESNTAAGRKPEHGGRQARGHHRRQFSFVPGDDRATVMSKEAMASKNAAVAQQDATALGLRPNDSHQLNRRSRSAECIGMGKDSRPVALGAADFQMSSQAVSCRPEAGPEAN
ncbi:hypothetical protein NM208_g9347 [Fusarium decemcellulare]|uniref:Uncharacterized protein n=1 Tax=Fusarium decemcellulare TaxID=57161 RepID=A0ACC1S216_9HYPO|nr:hypothetical protein NM208_g9347 [Fusarium decemcellulare]